MKSNIFICFFLLAFHVSFCQDERGIITKIDSINTLALEQYNKSDILQSINSFNLAIKLSDSINDSYGNAVAHFTLGKIYSYMKEYDDAERCFKKMLLASKDINDNYLIANSYLSLGDVYRNKKNRVNVIPYFIDALIYAQKDDVRDHKNNNKQDNLMFKIRISLSSHLLDMEKATEAFTYILRAEKSLDKTEFDAYNQGLLGYIYGRYFMKKESLFKANDKFEDSAAWLLEDNVTQNELDNTELKSNIYKQQSLVLSF